ncbi:extracellular solute-binding protein [Roseococcus suduntuyensis]|nr:extracellular solute-binding protein [Roseococcus suduntuyensis]
MGRRTVLLGAGALAAPAVLAQELPVLRVTHFGGPYNALTSVIAEPFAAARLGRVVYETENSVTALTKLQAQREAPPFDIVMLSRGFTGRVGGAGFLSPLDPARSDLVDGAIAPRNWGAAMLIDGIDIMYDRTKVTTPIESWLDLWRPDLRGLVTMPSASLPVYFVVMQIARALGGDPTQPAAIDAAFAKLREIKPNIRTFYSDPVQGSQMIERGEVAAAIQFAGRIAPVMRGNPNIVRASPREGVVGAPYDLCLVNNGRNREAAIAYIDFCLAEPQQSALAARLLVAPSHRRATVPEAAQNFLVPLDKVWFPDEEFAASRAAEWSRRWQREVQS